MLSFAFFFFASLRAALCTEKMTAISFHLAKSRTLVCLVFLSLHQPQPESPRARVAAPWSVQPRRRDDTGVWWQGLNSLSVQAPARRRARCRATFPQTHLRGATHTTALGPPVKNRCAFARTTRGFCCKRSIAILSALLSCESWSIANPGG